MDIAALRSQIPALSEQVWMNTGWSGPSPQSVVNSLKDRIDMEAKEPPASMRIMESAHEIRDEALQAVGRLMNVSDEELVMTRNTTEGLNIVMSGLDWQPGDEIVTCSLEHPSVLAPAWMIGLRHGVAVRIVELDPHDPADVILEKFRAAMTPRTRLIFVSHIQYSTGMRMPAPELARMAHENGAEILLDGAQTAGHIALDMVADDYDYYSIPGQKWMLGFEGVGALYIRRELLPAVHPAHTGGRHMESPMTADHIVPNHATMDKFLGGSGSIPLQAAFLEATRFIESIGVGNIEPRNLQLASRLKAQLRESPRVTVLSPEDGPLASGLVSFAVEGWGPEALDDHLWENNKIVVRHIEHPEGVRASLHFFNTEEEVDQLAAAVRNLA